MQELIEAGYVYIAKPPLYKLKQGKSERYIEKESELEEILLGDKLEQVRGHRPRRAAQFKLTETRWQRFARLLKQYEGWALGAARRVRPRRRARSSRSRGILDEQVADDRRRCVELLAREGLETASRTRPSSSTEDAERARRARGRDARPASRAPTASAARCSPPTSTASSSASTRSSSSWPARRRSRSRSATTPSEALSFEELRARGARRSPRRASSSSASRASAR